MQLNPISPLALLAPGSAVQCSAVQCSAVQCSAVQCSALSTGSRVIQPDLQESQDRAPCWVSRFHLVTIKLRVSRASLVTPGDLVKGRLLIAS
jgi:hypothetical protein